MVNAQYTFGRTEDTMLEPLAQLAAQIVRPAVFLATPPRETGGTAATRLKESQHPSERDCCGKGVRFIL
jgi:hypothetical protein